MDKLPVYCEFEFLENFFNLRNSFSMMDDDSIESWLTMKKVINSRCVLYLNNDSKLRESFDKNPYLKKLIKNSIAGGSEIVNGEYKMEDFKDNPIALILMTGQYITNSFHISINQFNWSSKVNLITRQLTFVVGSTRNNTFKGWQSVDIWNETPSSGLIIADPYILSHELSINNLFQILKNLLPKTTINAPYDISIFIGSKNMDIKDVQKKYQKIMDYLQDLDLNYKLNLSVHIIQGDKLHDRDILTNYKWIHSGHSFNYYNKNKQINKRTTLDVKSIASIDSNPHISLIKNFSELAKGTVGIDMIGNGINNLYNIYLSQ